MPRCKAMSKRSRERCQLMATRGRRVCRFHGGHSIVTNLKHGRNSQALGRLRDAYQRALEDPQLLDLRPEVAVLTVRQEQLLKRAEEDKDSPAFRNEAQRLYDLAFEAFHDEDERLQDKLEDLGAHLEAGADQDRAWEQIVTHVERRSRRAEKALDLKLRHEVAINGRDLVAVFARLIDIVFAHAPPDAAARIVDAFDVEITGGAPQIARAAKEGDNGGGPASD